MDTGKKQKTHSSTVRELMAGVDFVVPFDPSDKDSPKGIPINFDNAATTPAFKSVLAAIESEMNTYAAIGRSKGAKSSISTGRYEEYRKTVLQFFGARAKEGSPEKYSVSYTYSATDGMNRLANMLLRDKKDLVVSTRMEHHANDLPWRNRGTVLHAELDGHGRLDLDEVQRLLTENSGKIQVVTATAASNVTGYVNDVHEIARLAHKHGAKIVVDGAQIAAHKPFRMYGEDAAGDIDFFVFSAHKIYAPFGGGAIVGLKDELDKAPPAWRGGGNVSLVSDETDRLLDSPERHEAGSPNYFGVVAMQQAMKEIMSANIGGFDYVVEHEVGLLKKVVDAMREMPEIKMYNFCADPDCAWCGEDAFAKNRVGVVVFNVKGMSSQTVAKDLALKGVALREGAFCAHPYAARLMGVSDEQMRRAGGPPRMLRLSFGIYNTEEEAEAFLKALQGLVAANADRAAAFGVEAADWAAPVKSLDRGVS